MFNDHRCLVAILIAMAGTGLASAPSLAQQSADRDSREIMAYALTEAGLARYTQATRNLGALARRRSDTCDEGEETKSLDQSVARFDAVPGVRAALKAAGMTAREFIVFSLAVFQTGMAAWALDQPGGKLPPGIAMANVNFYRAHAAALKKMGEQSKSGDCDDVDDGDDV